ncbi:SDR family oxidoreductase [Streptomyces sp. HNM0574]|uniref:SDR family NAD(P)-dependent oxidoreductase n=1 Tax=Streptomyces sp. HNM0574 TaxID=2714954 RepID=UPI00146A93F8|nr:SDR family oxidoreductase [Streptomyces sp. HNM0574]NLU69437.1 SDR family oxidoreductase [Streptomyces sp. HNM0574]
MNTDTRAAAHPSPGLRIRPLAGKAALVTGGSRGIGAAVALRLAADGADVAVTYEHSERRAAEVAAAVGESGVRGLALRADGTRAEEVREAVAAAVRAFGGLDILVNNAGVGHAGPLETVTTADLDHVLAVNVRAPYLAAQAAAPHLGEGGRIVTIGSCVADRVVFPGMSLYAMSKSACGGMTRALARELGPRGITVNTVAPGPVDTALNPADGEGAEAQRTGTALGRYGLPDEIADTVAHLAGPGGRWITGASVAVDGGFNA